MKCRICNNSIRNHKYIFKELMFKSSGEDFHYFKCSRCGCLQIAKIPKDMSKYYPSNYYTNTVQSNFVVNLLLKKRDDFAFSTKGFIGKFIYYLFPNPGLSALGKMSINRKLKILDIGCGQGMNLLSLLRHGYNNILGVEPFLQKNVIVKNKLIIKKQNLNDVGGLWDVVMFHHSLEHIPDQINTLKHVKNILSEKGICIIRIPTISSYAWHRYKSNWVALDVPRHLFLHSRLSIKTLAKKAGLKVKTIIDDSIAFQFWGSEQNIKKIPLVSKRSYSSNPFRSIFTHSQMREFRRRAEELNENKQGDQICVILTH